MTRKLISNITIVICTLTLGACGGSGGETAPPTQPPTANTPPAISGSAPTSIAVGGAYSFTPSASDADGDTLSFSVQNKPSWMDVQATTGKLSGRPAMGDEGNYTNITVGASDGATTTMMTAFNVRVEPNSTPSISGTPPSTITAGQNFSFAPVVSDPEGDQLTFSIQNLPTWAVFNSSTGQVSGTPQNQHEGVYPDIRIEVSDQFSSAVLPPFTLEVELPASSNNAPVVSGSPATTVASGASYSFIPGAYDPDGDALTFSLQNKPGWMTLDLPTGVLGGTPGSTDVGEYTDLILMATDGQSTVSLPAFTVTVVPGTRTNTAPTISGSPATSVVAGSVYVFAPTAFDADGNTLQFSIQNLPPWGVFNTASGILSGAPQTGEEGTYGNIIIIVSDGVVATAFTPFNITVTPNSVPVISGSPDVDVEAGTVYSFTPIATDSEGDTLMFSIVNRPSWAAFDSTTGALTGTPDVSDAGVYGGIKISVTDNQNTARLPTFSIAVTANRAPSIVGTPATTATEGVAYSFTPVASDKDDDALTFSVSGLPSWAVLDSSDGSLTGTPALGDAGTYVGIVISVTDGQATASLPAFSIDVADAGVPTIGGTPANSVNVGQAYEFTPVANDLNGDALTFTIQNSPSWASFDTNTGALTGSPATADIGVYSNIIIGVSDGTNNASLAPFEILVNETGSPIISGVPESTVEAGSDYLFVPVASDPENQTLTFSIANLPSWAAFSTSTGELAGRPAISDAGVYSNIVISVTDGFVATPTSLPAFSITVNANQPPELSGTPSVEVIAGQAYQFTPTATDADGDTINFLIQNRPDWASFSASTGKLYGVPEANDVGVHANVFIIGSDGTASGAIGPFTITVTANQAPTISGVPAVSIDVGEAYSFTPVATDVDNDTLSFVGVNIPTWLSFDTETGALNGTPTAVDAGVYNNIVITVVDGQGFASLPGFSLTVNSVNGAPTIGGTPSLSVAAGNAYSFTPTANDPDGDSLSFSIQNRPSWAAFSSIDGALTGSPVAGNAGEYATVLISVSDGTQSATLASFTITVTANAAPVISGTPPTSIDAGSSYNFTPNASDADGDNLTFSINNAPSWAAFRASDGRLSGTPSQDDVGIDSSIVISVSDGSVTAALAPFSISVIGNTAPIISGTPVTALNVGETYAFTPTGTDADGDTLTFSIENKPAWAAFSTTTGTLSGIAGTADVGSYANIIISVTDGTDTVSLLAFTLVVSEVTTGSATISWTPPTQNEDGSTLSNLSGYRFYYGTSSGNYTGQVDVDVAGISTYMIENLAPGTYYFVVTALSAAGLESAYSGEVVSVIGGN